jgi:glycosyltransferase involved in cell wall biosynthesis
MASRRGTASPNVSILILTLNEEDNIGPCLDSVAWSNDIVVLDSGSRDKTVPMAKKRGARVVYRAFDDFAGQQNYAVKKIRFKNPWLFYLDADERVTPELRDDLLRVAGDPSLKDVSYFCGRKNYLWGRWLKYSFRTDNILRFFRPEKIRFKQVGHGPANIVNGGQGHLKTRLEHYNFSKGMEEWIDKHNRYSSQEAREGFENGASGFTLRPLLALDTLLKRLKLKPVSNRLPFKPLVKFFWIYIVKRGFLDGREGFTYCALQSFYEYLILLKVREIELRAKGLKP